MRTVLTSIPFPPMDPPVDSSAIESTINGITRRVPRNRGNNTRNRYRPYQLPTPNISLLRRRCNENYFG